MTFLPIYSVRFTNATCEIDGLENIFVLIDAGLSQVTINSRLSEKIEFSDNLIAEVIFKKQKFIMNIELVSSEVVNEEYHYSMGLNFHQKRDFNRWLTFIKSIFGLYLKKAIG